MPKASDLTTADRVRAVARTRPNAEADDTRLDLLVSAASDAVRDYTRRDFLFLAPPSGFDPAATASKTFEYAGGGFVSFGLAEAREIVSVTVDGVALTVDQWRAGPTGQTSLGTYLFLGSLPTSCTRRVERGVDLVVVAKWGIVNLPSAVELATIDTVSDWWHNPQGARARTFENVVSDDDGGLGFERGALPMRARLLLEAYRR